MAEAISMGAGYIGAGAFSCSAVRTMGSYKTILEFIKNYLIKKYQIEQDIIYLFQLRINSQKINKSLRD